MTKFRTALSSLSLAGGLLIAGPAAHAEEYWVNVDSGNDLNTGLTASSPLKTIKRAREVSQLTAGTELQTIHLAPGTYSIATGEVFPIEMQTWFKLQGDGGSVQTIIDAGSAPKALNLYHWHTRDAQGNHTSYNTGDHALEGVTVRNAGIGIQLGTPNNQGFATTTIRDVVAQYCGTGLSLEEAGSTFLVTGQNHVNLHDFHAHNNDLGVYCDCPSSMTWLGGSASRNSSHGIFCEGSNFEKSGGTVKGVSVEYNGGSGVTGTYFGNWTFVNVLIAGNGMHGFDLRPDFVASLIGCTISGNTGIGVNTGQFDLQTLILKSSIIAGNSDDVTGLASFHDVQIDHCLISPTDPQGPELAATGVGNIIASPTFVSVPAGDYRLLKGSPAIDSALPIIDPDLKGQPRAIDGDLDGTGTSDMGALEYRPFEGPAIALIGQPLSLTLDGLAASNVVIGFSPAPLLDTPILASYGEVWLDPSMPLRRFPQTFVGAGTRPINIQIPFVSAFIGQRWSFQALRTTTTPGPGLATMNAIEVLIQL